MAKRIPQSDIDEVLTRVSIVDVVGDYVALKAEVTIIWSFGHKESLALFWLR